MKCRLSTHDKLKWLLVAGWVIYGLYKYSAQPKNLPTFSAPTPNIHSRPARDVDYEPPTFGAPTPMDQWIIAGWIVAGAIGIVIIALVISKRVPVQVHPIAPPKTKIPRNPYVSVSSQEPIMNYGSNGLNSAVNLVVL